MSDSIIMLYATCANRDEADKIATLLVRNRLAACVNILGEVQSVYEWKGAIEKSKEIALVAKTTASAFQSVEQFIREHHSYECPCIVAWPIEHGHEPFLDWVKSHVSVKQQSA